MTTTLKLECAAMKWLVLWEQGGVIDNNASPELVEGRSIEPEAQ